MTLFNVPNCFRNDCDCAGTPPPSRFSCTPSKCSGSKCCCCVSSDIASSVRARCYDQIFFSCNSDGTSPGPGETPFDLGCIDCFDRCDRALGGSTACSSISQPVGDTTWQPSPADWFNFPPGIGPCGCDCEEFVDPNDPSQGCNLTCVKCAGLRCNADVEITTNNCAYQFNLTPSSQCCGSNKTVDVVFVIDFNLGKNTTIADSPEFASIANGFSELADGISLLGAQPRFGLLAYGFAVVRGSLDRSHGDNNGGPCLLDNATNQIFSNGQLLTTDINELKQVYESLFTAEVATAPDFQAIGRALRDYTWSGSENIIIHASDRNNEVFEFEQLISGDFSDVPFCAPVTGDLSNIDRTKDDDPQPMPEFLIEFANSIGVTLNFIQDQRVRIFPPIERHDARRADMANNTGGLDLDIFVDFSDHIPLILDNLVIPPLSSCGCLDTTPMPVELCRGGTGPQGDECLDPVVDIPIGICVEENNGDCDICNEPMVFSACGEIIVIEPDPDTIDIVCCSSLGAGCNCPSDDSPPAGCCGASCGTDICDGSFSSLQTAIDTIWCECHSKAAQGLEGFLFETSSCSAGCIIPDDPNDSTFSSIENCIIKIPDGSGGHISISRSQVKADITAAWALCEQKEKPPPSISCLSECNRQDECIVGSPVCGKAEDIRDCRKAACLDSHKGCVSVRNPDTVILNNGIGLVAYESMDNVSVIKIEQFNTSIPAKILPNRRTNYGRLEHSAKWTHGTAGSDLKLAKMYYFESLPTHFVNGIDGVSTTGDITDRIIFRNGPLQNQCFDLDNNPTGTDEIGDFILLNVPNDTILSNDFLSLDDVYNIEWFIIDSDDAGLIGSLSTSLTSNVIPGSEFLLPDDNAVNVVLELSSHIYNGQPVPVAYPSITSAHNYMNAIENSHYVYVVYQALEDQKWNLYMRQLRLSEYSREQAISDGGTIALQDLGITELIYRVICVNDDCNIFGNDFLVKRTVSFEVLLQDSREVFNESLLNTSESWPVCPGEPEGSFLKKKVIVELTHSVLANRCPDQFEFNEIFYNWESGDEFPVPFTNITSNDLFTLVKKINDNAIDLGDSIIQISSITITSSQASAIWYDDSSVSVWVTLDDVSFNNLLQYKGLDISEPIPITEFEEGHCTHPVISVNANNEIFVVYECTDSQVHQIHITGTAIPSTSFPLGVFVPKNLDANLDYFLSPGDFNYKNSITISNDGINQLPDMYIDANDVIHVAWQSNKDNYWEIYYANSKSQFNLKRITAFKSKSLKPSIIGDTIGNIHIAWHDNRFGNWEIMMAYKNDERILTLLEQDPYLAGIRNAGYSHSTDVAPLVMENKNNTVLCVSNLFVRFFSDRLLSHPEFDIRQSDFPMSFQIPGFTEDRQTSQLTYPEIIDWEPGSPITIDSINGNSFNPPIGFDTVLAGSFYDTINISYTVVPLYIRFAAGETPDIDAELINLKQKAVENGEDPNILTNADTSWKSTAWINSSSLNNNTTTLVSDLVNNNNTNIPDNIEPTISTVPRGRYKKIFIVLSLGDDLTDSISFVEVISVVKDRFCISPGETLTGFLDITPFIRLDGKGNKTIETPIPVGVNKNQTYFFSVIATKDNGQLLAFDDPKRSFSCETCAGNSSPWDSSSCTYSVNFLNISPSGVTEFYNARIRFYTDDTKNNLVAQFDAFKDGNLEYFTLDDNQPAQNAWDEQGLEIFFNKNKTITLWPMLSNDSGLLCGVTYWVETEICVGISESPCIRSSLKQTEFETWNCSCDSPRWKERFGDAPINIKDTVRWASSGDGFSDTRLTETGINVNNYNPIIRLRTDLTGIVIYESNRDDTNKLINNKHFLYGTAFSVFPNSTMYASGAEAIDSKFGEILIQSDVPITACNGTNCQDGGPAIEGRNANFAFDQYDNIFLAAEQFSDQTKCLELSEGNQRSILVHRCGIQAANLLFTPEKLGGAGTFACNASEILGKTAPLITDKTFRKIIKLARVNNKFAIYHITRSQKSTAVINQCNIEIDIITEPGTIAIRLKNKNNPWSTWFPFDSETGSNTIRIPWVLTVGSGVKNVTIEAATYQGLSATFSLSVVADYRGIDHVIKFYKITTLAVSPNPSGNTYEELLSILSNNDAVFTQENILSQLEGVPVAGIRQPTVKNNELIEKTGEFIFIEIIPSQNYLEGLGILDDTLSNNDQQVLSPTFDVLQQGNEDLFSVPTLYDKINKVFKGIFPVQKEDKTFHKDGLSFVIPHFQQDCSDVSALILLGTGEYSRDQFNVVTLGGVTNASEIETSDIWLNERDETGKIKNQIDIRGTEDPYFVFGDPNYRLKKQNE